MPLTRAQREEACRVFVCPRCHAESTHPCRSKGGYAQLVMPGRPASLTRVPGKPMKGVHIERLAKVQP